MLEEIFSKDRRLRISYNSVLNSGFANQRLFETIDRYLDDFARFNALTTTEILSRHDAFVRSYLIHLQDFVDTGKYPYELGKGVNLERIDYDICLILSAAITVYRHRILSNLLEYCRRANGNMLIIGLGSGIELEMLAQFGKEIKIEAYDIRISNFVKDRFKSLNIHEKEFTSSKELYKNIIAVEILEHLSDPYAFISMCSACLESQGKFVVTTSTNVPHFDHLYNFTNEPEFENKTRESGLLVTHKEIIKNDYFSKDINAMNTWYVLEKCNGS